LIGNEGNVKGRIADWGLMYCRGGERHLEWVCRV